MDPKQKYKLKKFVHELAAIRGRHTELVSVYIPSGYDMNKIISHLQSEQDTASNIKDKNNRKNVIDSLEKMIRHLRLFKATPKNGLAVFAGNASNLEGRPDIKVWSIEPPFEINVRLYRCDQTFKLDILLEMLVSHDTYGLVVMDNREATIGLLNGKKITVLKQMHSGVPGKTKAGGQCLDPSTRINLADGQYVSLDTIQKGDIVKAYDFANRKFVDSEVKDVWNVTKDKLFIIKAGNSIVSASHDHVFFVESREVAAGELKAGDRLLGEDGNEVAIDDIEFKIENFNLIDISVEIGNFIANGIVVHNSALRFARLRDEAAMYFYERIAEVVNNEFAKLGKDLKGIIVGGPGMTKETFVNGNYLHTDMKKKVVGIKDLTYTSEYGLKELIERSHDVLAEEEILKEKAIMDEFFKLLATKPDMVVYGLEDVKKALEYGAVSKLLMSEDYEGAEELEEKTEDIGAEFFVISNDTEEGVQLKNLGGVGAVLRFAINSE